jgi:hypothetical protein
VIQGGHSPRWAAELEMMIIIIVLIIIIITTENCDTGHCTHTLESADVKYIRANAGANDMGTINSSDRIAATLYSLGIWFVSGIYV